MATEAAFTAGLWECQVGHSDWGMPCAHIIVRKGETGNDCDTWIAEVPSVTPYCMGASSKDKRRAATQLANARLMAASPDMFEVVRQFVAHYPVGINPNLDEAYWPLCQVARAAISRATEGAV